MAPDLLDASRKEEKFMEQPLQGKKIAFVVANGFEQVELTGPQKILQEAGATTTIVSPEKNKVKAWQHDHWGDEITVDQSLDQAQAEDFDAVVLPGGVMNPDHLRTNEKAQEFVRDFFDSGKVVAAICHGPWTLINAGLVEGRTLTSWPSLAVDLKNAGAKWVDKEVVSDQGLVTSRKPADIKAFGQKIIEEMQEGRHDRRLSHPAATHNATNEATRVR
jgi:protease I